MKDPTPTQTPGNEAPEEGLAGYPAGVMPILQALADQGGLLLADQSRRLAPWAGRDPARVAAYLLPFAAAFATAPISGFRVGAVVAAPADGGGFTFYLGANMEFAGLCLQQTVHAETAAVIHAWHRGAADIAVIAVTEPPCGYCRQFLTELHNSRALTVAVAGKDGQPMRASTLDRLLPDAFGPRDLGRGAGLMRRAPGSRPLVLKNHSRDPVVAEALAAATASHAPYTGNRAGCAVATAAERTFGGRYVETAAFNPSLTPLQTALVLNNLFRPGRHDPIRRAVLVERPAASRQRASVEALLGALAPTVRLEYHEAVCPE